ncbi:MAG: DUF3726 domain-containing protein [Pseudomonadota bacterium]
MATHTLSEITATATKATRAAGFSWGVAEEAGLAVRRLSAHGLPGAEALAVLLTNKGASSVGDQGPAPGCGLSKMIEMLDMPPHSPAQLGPIKAPLLVVGFALADDGHWTVGWPGGAVHAGPEGLMLSGALPGPVAPVSVRQGCSTGQPLTAHWRSRPVAPDAWEKLEVLAATLLVPESERSRTSGAGPDA